MVRLIKVNERKINSTGKGLNFGRMGPNIRVNTLKAKRKEKGNLCGLMRVILKASSSKIIFMVMEFIVGMMVESTVANGN